MSGSGGPSTLPLSSSIPTRQRFVVPPRSLEKTRCRPSGDHTGSQSMAASVVTATAPPPDAATVRTSLWPALETLQYATRWPWGDQRGWTASSGVSIRRRAPEDTSIAHSSPVPERLKTSSQLTVETTISRASGDQLGL